MSNSSQRLKGPVERSRLVACLLGPRDHSDFVSGHRFSNATITRNRTPLLGAGNACTPVLWAKGANFQVPAEASCEEGHGRHLAGLCRLSATPRFAPGARVRSGDLRRRADWKRVAPTRRWSRRSSNGSDSSYRRLETTFRMIRLGTIRAGARLPSRDGTASPAAPRAWTPNDACSAWLPAGHTGLSPAARRPGRA
jgi:hypothetical protein